MYLHKIIISGLISLLPYLLAAQCVAGDCNTGKGVFLMEDGARYIGEFVKGKINGKGICYYPDGSRYEGLWVRGFREGQGVLIHPNGQRESGKWENDQLVEAHFSSTLNARERPTYDGQTGCVSGDCQNGPGTYMHPSGAIYKGDFKDGEIHGKGVCHYPDGSKYEGDWEHRYPDGRGVKTYPNGKVVNGYWEKGHQVDEFGNLIQNLETAKGDHIALQTGCISGNCYDGYGAFAYADGSLYQGNFLEGKPEGQGTFFYNNNDQYSGDFQQGMPHGKGKLFKAGGRIITGRWVEGEYVDPNAVNVATRTGCIEGNCRNGNGKYLYSNGATYAGPFQNNLPHGKGTVVFANGDKYTGYMANATFNGLGTFYRVSGEVYTGYWKDGKYAGKENPNKRKPSIATKPRQQRSYQEKPEPESTVWAVVIGVSTYDHMPVLRYTDDDAYRIYAFLKSPEGGALPDEQIRILIDEDATKEKITATMRHIFGQADEDDMILLYFSGHGLKDSFLPIDFNGYSNKLFHSEINAILNASRAKNKLCLADACHSGNLLAMKGAQAEVHNILTSYYRNLAKAAPGTALVMSSKSNETSLESSGLRQGVFTHYLIRGLKGEANTNKDEKVTISELYTFIRSHVRQYTSNRQSPVILGDYNYNMPVAGIR